jgi:hypothetical protein
MDKRQTHTTTPHALCDVEDVGNYKKVTPRTCKNKPSVTLASNSKSFWCPNQIGVHDLLGLVSLKETEIDQSQHIAQVEALRHAPTRDQSSN